MPKATPRVVKPAATRLQSGGLQSGSSTRRGGRDGAGARREFLMGSDDGTENEMPQQRVHLDAFRIGKTP